MSKLKPKYSNDIEIKQGVYTDPLGLSSGSRYDYLIRKNIVTPPQLQRAFGLSKKLNKSVEHILIETYKIKKDIIGKAFSQFYDCKFRSFDASLPVPVELLSNLKKAFLLNEVWIPISWSKEGIEVLVDDPRNLKKTDNIKALMKTTKIHFSVAIREDIQAFINSFFSKDRLADAAAEDITDDIDIPDTASRKNAKRSPSKRRMKAPARWSSWSIR